MMALHDGKLFAVSAAPAAPKLSQLDSLDVFALAAANAFGERMRAEVSGLLQALELCAEKRAAGIELAAAPEALAANFDSLLRVRPLGRADAAGAHQGMHATASPARSRWAQGVERAAPPRCRAPPL
jgi:hypothetical protein